MARRRGLGLTVMLLVFAAWNSAAMEQTAPDPEALVGIWQVDLRPNPEAEPYYQDFVIESIEENSIRGHFYGTPIENGQINTTWGKVHFAFTTSDGSGTYHTSGVLEDSGLQGTTHSLGRGFLAVWTAEPKE